MRQGNYAQIRPLDVANGEGIRVSIFVSGCTHNCPECFNQLYMDFKYGSRWGSEQTTQVVEYLRNPVIAGLTLLGGEPMQNLWLTEVVQEIKTKLDLSVAADDLGYSTWGSRKRKTIWVYSGYTWEQIQAHSGRRALLEECDVLVDGLFKPELKDLRLRFRGSANQRIIDVAASKQSGFPVDYQLASPVSVSA